MVHNGAINSPVPQMRTFPNFSRTTLSATVLAAALLAGCGGGDDRLAVSLLGSLDGRLADNAAATLSVSSAASSTQPWIIGEGQFSATDLAPVAAAWRNGQPVALFNAVQSEVDQLSAALGVPTKRLALQPTDVYLLRPKGTSGYCIYSFMVYPPDDGAMVIGPDGEISLDPVWSSEEQRRQALMDEVVKYMQLPC